jgi:signal transduction histidine kinase
LAEDQVSSILEDDHGFLWLSGYRGFSRIAKSALREYRRGLTALLPVWFIEHANGAATSSVFHMPSAWKGHDGRLWFAGLRGLIMIDPAAARPDQQPVPIVIEETLVDRAPLSPSASSDDPPRLAARVRDIEFRFVGLSLGDPAGVRFKYQLEGYDTDWTDAGNRRAAFYTNLPSGEYRFRVMAANGDGVWNEQAATFDFLKDAHIYETWWMRLLFAGALGGAAWLAYRTRVSEMHKRFGAVLAERNRIARELHDTVEQGLTGVMLQLDTVAAHWSSAPEVARRGLDMARNMARHCMGEARSAVRDLRSESLHAGDAVAALRQMASEFGSAGAPEVRIDVQGAPYQLSRNVEMTLLRIGQEALTNAIKHAHASRIDLAVQFTANHIGLRVRDDGVGFAAESSLVSAASGHFGLLGMRERANKVGGNLVIHSSSGGGTTVDFQVPQANA